MAIKRLTEIGSEVYETNVNGAGRIRIPRSLMSRKFVSSCENKSLIVGPHIMNSRWTSIIVLYDGKRAEEFPLRNIEIKTEGRDVIIPEAKKLLDINDDKIMVVGANPSSFYLWNPREFHMFNKACRKDGHEEKRRYLCKTYLQE